MSEYSSKSGSTSLASGVAGRLELGRAAIAFTSPPASSSSPPRFRLANAGRLAGRSFGAEPEILVFGAAHREEAPFRLPARVRRRGRASPASAGKRSAPKGESGGMQPFAAWYVARFARHGHEPGGGRGLVPARAGARGFPSRAVRSMSAAR